MSALDRLASLHGRIEVGLSDMPQIITCPDAVYTLAALLYVRIKIGLSHIPQIITCPDAVYTLAALLHVVTHLWYCCMYLSAEQMLGMIKALGRYG